MKRTISMLILTLVLLCGLAFEARAYRDLETGQFITRDPAGFVDGPNVYTYVRQNPWSAFDPEGLEIQFMTTKDLNEPSGAKAVVPYTPTEKQQKAFNDAMGKLRDKGGDLGKALYNAANSSGKDAVKLEVQHAPGEIPGGQREVRDKETGNIIQNPYISLDLDEKNFSSARTVPGEQKKSYEAQISADPAVIVGHELGHALVEAEDPENVTAVENPLRKSLEEPKGPRKKYRSYQVPSVASPETAQKVKDFTKKWKDATPTPPTPPEKKPKQ